MSDKKITPTRQAKWWEKATGKATPTREATTWEKLTDQATPTTEATSWEKLTGQATPIKEATAWEKWTNQATPTREATWWEKFKQGRPGNYSTCYRIGEKLGQLAVIVLVIVFCVPGLILDKLFPDKRGTSRLVLYSLLFWSFAGGTIYLESRLGTAIWFFGIQLVLISLLNIVLGLATSVGFIKPRLPLAAQTILAKSQPLLPWIGWSGFVLGLFFLIWSLVANWPSSTLLPELTAIIAGVILVRPIQTRIDVIKLCLGTTCIALATYQLIFGWNLNPNPVSGYSSSQIDGSKETRVEPRTFVSTRDKKVLPLRKSVPAPEPEATRPVELQSATQPTKETENPGQNTPVDTVAASRKPIELPQYNWEISDPGRQQQPGPNARLWWWLEKELEQNPQRKATLDGLAEAIHQQAGGSDACITEYSKKGAHVWAAGFYDNQTRGFICHSVDEGTKWVRQWVSEAGQPEPVYGIYFSDAVNGWAVSLKAILHTTNGGSSWERIFECEESMRNLSSVQIAARNLFILDKKQWILTDSSRPSLCYYLSNDAGVSWEKVSMTLKTGKEVRKMEQDLGGQAVHYGGVYSYEGRHEE